MRTFFEVYNGFVLAYLALLALVSTGLAVVGAIWQALCTSGAEFLAAR